MHGLLVHYGIVLDGLCLKMELVKTLWCETNLTQGFREKSVVRDVAILAQNGQWNDLCHLVEFGIQITQKNVKVVVENTVRYCEEIDVTVLILDKCVEIYDSFGT
eukprot:513315_1